MCVKINNNQQISVIKYVALRLIKTISFFSLELFVSTSYIGLIEEAGNKWQLLLIVFFYIKARDKGEEKGSGGSGSSARVA